MVLRAVIEGRPWLVDAGFGGNASMVPLGLDAREPQLPPRETYRVTPSDEGLLLQALIERKTPGQAVSPWTRIIRADSSRHRRRNRSTGGSRH